MSIFGTGNFKFSGTGTPDSTERELGYSFLEPEYQIGDIEELVNPITRERYFNLRGNYARLVVTYYVFKETTPSTSTQLVYTYLGQNVTVKPRGTIILDDSGGTPVQFTITNISVQPLTLLSEQDVLYITFESKKHVDINQSLT